MSEILAKVEEIYKNCHQAYTYSKRSLIKTVIKRAFGCQSTVFDG